MLDSLHIQNYRLFKDLKIEKLGRVNLISGKNNSGKTALLEALRILESDFDPSVVNQIIQSRGDWKETVGSLSNDNEILRENYISLLYKDSIEAMNGFKINDKEAKYLKLRFETGEELSFYINGKYMNTISTPDINYKFPKDKAVFVPMTFENINRQKYWSQTYLTPKHNEAIEILKIVEPRIITFGIDNIDFKVLLEGQTKPIPFKRLGDGANRLLTIALALVNSKNKMLLIDEFEVGLYHGVQEQLWEIIFKYAKEWHIQVFVTTHSLDTVRTFSVVSDKYDGMGEYLRLQKSRMTDEIEVVIYSKKSLNYAIEDSLEMR